MTIRRHQLHFRAKFFGLVWNSKSSKKIVIFQFKSPKALIKWNVTMNTKTYYDIRQWSISTQCDTNIECSSFQFDWCLCNIYNNLTATHWCIRNSNTQKSNRTEKKRKVMSWWKPLNIEHHTLHSTLRCAATL